LRTIDLDIGDDSRTRRIRLVAAALGMSAAEFIRASVDIAIEHTAVHDRYLGLMLAEQTRKSRR
jgi:hypothetical protein